MRTLLPGSLLALAAALVGFGLFAGEPVSFPEGYRSWTHVKSMVIEDDHPLADPFAGIHHVYANDKAVTGYESGRFPDGSVIVFDLLEHTAADATVQEGERKFVGVMVRDRSAWPQTAGWGFEAFDGDSRTDRLVEDGGASCFACHTARKQQDYVFSEMRK